jgi:hypothetical protein
VKYSRKKTIGIKLVKNNDKKLNFEKKCITCGKNGVLCKDQCQKCYQKEANKKHKSKHANLCEECKINVVYCSGSCRSCYEKIRKKKKLEKKEKICEKCGKKGISTKNMCANCYAYRNGVKKPDLNKKCEKCGKLGVYHKNRCRSCYRARLQRKILSDDIPVQKHAKRGEACITPDGYRIITKKGHPNSRKKDGRILEHTFVMSEFIKRPLIKGETVHHKNGVRDDNRIENLELWSTNHPPGQRVKDKIEWAKEILKQYEDFNL